MLDIRHRMVAALEVSGATAELRREAQRRSVQRRMVEGIQIGS